MHSIFRIKCREQQEQLKQLRPIHSVMSSLRQEKEQIDAMYNQKISQQQVEFLAANAASERDLQAMRVRLSFAGMVNQSQNSLFSNLFLVSQ